MRRRAHVHREVKNDHHQMKNSPVSHALLEFGPTIVPRDEPVQESRCSNLFSFSPARFAIITLGQDNQVVGKWSRLFAHSHMLMPTVSVPTTTFSRNCRQLLVSATKWKISKNKNENSLFLFTNKLIFLKPSHPKSYSIKTEQWWSPTRVFSSKSYTSTMVIRTRQM